jgi:hypothetical protein
MKKPARSTIAWLSATVIAVSVAFTVWVPETRSDA